MVTVSEHPIQMDGLFRHLCSAVGMYSKETFLSLYSAITRMVRDQHLKGMVLTRTLGDPDFETMVQALDNMPDLPLYRLTEMGSSLSGENQNGFLLVLTDQLCATLFWSSTTHHAYHLYEGGWTFHPGDTRTLVQQVVSMVDQPELMFSLDATNIDRRYDDKLNKVTTALVQGLENRNRELTVALDQLQVLSKRHADTERMAAIGQLSSVIAHEIRNPLGLIDLYAKISEEQLKKLVGDSLQVAGAEDDPQHELKAQLANNLSLIRQATNSLETILSELTSYSRPLQLNNQQTDIAKLVTDLCDFYRPSYDEKQVELTVSLPETSDILEIDADKIRQALINLLKNALEVSTAGSAVSVKLASRQHDPNWYIRVSDEGTGIPQHLIQKLFTPYFSTKGNGTGLGLAHSRKILQAHGGTVELLSSTPGKGSTFALVLPKTLARPSTPI